MPRVIITTVGTSLLGNIKRDRKLEKPTDQDLSNYLRHTNPVEASAETNSLSRLLVEGNEIVLVHSETDEGKQCAEMLGKHFESSGYKVTLHKVRYLSYAESQFKMRGLCSLVGDLCELIRQEQKAGKEICINATGGFKAEIAYSTLVGLLFDIPVYYIHDAFHDIIEM
ncbi:MAG: putative CRISPR-associated protein, partial [Candidatus Eremiobacteraeota bacterium]|nr:putative CRISPR-associated protein [Candidatus Eremiobacteraeota bacterium]